MVAYYFAPIPAGAKRVAKLKLEMNSFNNNFTRNDVGIIVDYRLPHFIKRLWVVDLNTGKTLVSSRVSHASKSGRWLPTEFSNVPGSNMSSKGLFKTSHRYESKHGKGVYKIGMRIIGLEAHNNKVLERAIVFHTGDGWSSGCFMTGSIINKKIIDLTENGAPMLVLGIGD